MSRKGSDEHFLSRKEASDYNSIQVQVDEGDDTSDEISIITSGKRVTEQAFPMMISFSVSFILLATAMISGRNNGDSDHLAATGLITTLASTVSAASFEPLLAVGILNSTTYGEFEALQKDGKPNRSSLEEKIKIIRHHNKNGTFVAMTIAGLPTLALCYSEDLLTVVFQQNDAVAKIAQEYLRVFAAAMYGWSWRVVNEQIMFSCRKLKFAVIIGIINFILTLGLSIFLVFKLNLGLAGIAIGFVVEAYLTPIMNTLYLMFDKDFRQFNLFREWSFDSQLDWQQIKNILINAFPLFLYVSNEVGAQAAISLLMGILGKDELVAQNFMSQLFYFVLVANISFANATGQEFGRAFGAKLFHNANRYAIGGLISEIILILPLLIAVSAYPPLMIWVGTGSQENSGENWFDITHQLAPISAGAIALDAIGCNLLRVLWQSGQNMYPSLFSILCLWLGVGAGYGLGFPLGLGAPGVAAGYGLGLLIRALGLGALWSQTIKPQNLQARFERAALPQPEQKSCFQHFRDKLSSLPTMFTSCIRRQPQGGYDDLRSDSAADVTM